MKGKIEKLKYLLGNKQFYRIIYLQEKYIPKTDCFLVLEEDMDEFISDTNKQWKEIKKENIKDEK